MTAAGTYYWSEVEAGRYSYQQCRNCGAQQAFPRTFCARCGGGDLEWRRSAGRGKVAAITVIHRAPTPDYRDRVPYAIALVDLSEGVRILAHAASDLAVGDSVALSSRPHDGRLLLYVDRANRRAE